MSPRHATQQLSQQRALLLWALGLMQVLGVAHAGPKVPLSNLMQFLEHSRDLAQHNPQRSLVCFDCYLPLLHVIAQEYETSYAACLDTAVAAKLTADNATEPERERMENSTLSLCEIFDGCKLLQDPVAYFDCYANAGTQNMKSTYAVSANATEALTHIREQYRLIESEESRCTSASERTYVKDTAETYDQLQKCLQDAMQESLTSAESSHTTEKLAIVTAANTEEAAKT